MWRETVESIKVVTGKLVPPLTSLLLVFFGASPVSLSGLTDIFPNLVAISIFYWGLYSPDNQKALFVFLLGLFQDVLLNLPFGTSALAFLVLHWIVVTQRHLLLGKSFLITWLGFALVSIIPPFTGWLLLSLLHMQVVPAMPGVFQYMLTLAVYPFVTWLLIQLHKLVVDYN